MPKEKANILVVDDESDMRNMLTSILKTNHNVVLATSGKEALKILENEQIDLVLLDIKMPDLNGVEVLKLIKKSDPDQEVIMITALKEIQPAVESMKLGAYDYISKPFEADELMILIEKALKKKSLTTENAHLRYLLKNGGTFEDLIGRTEIMKTIFKLINDVSMADSTVLISGESGTGKELVAKAIHNRSKRSDKPFVIVNCAALPENLIESELFGYEKGAFTGALDKKIGKFELADQGTIFLDEIGTMPISTQAKLLRVIENGTIDRVGGGKPISINVRIIAATNINFKKEIEEGKFREDLYFRLNVIPINMPPLRKRKEDIPLFINYFIDKHNKILNKNIKGFSERSMNILINHNWPGNVRELQNLVERVVVLGKDGAFIEEEDLPIKSSRQSYDIEAKDLKEATEIFEKNYILKALDDAGGNQSKAAKILGLHRTTLLSRLEALGIN